MRGRGHRQNHGDGPSRLKLGLSSVWPRLTLRRGFCASSYRTEIPVSTIHAAAMSLSGQTHRQMIRFVEKLLEHVAQTGGTNNGVQVERVFEEAIASMRRAAIPPQ